MSAVDSKCPITLIPYAADADLISSDHANDYCMLEHDSQEKPSLWMCYGGGAGLGGYGGYKDYVRRVRFFDFDMGPGRVTTYKRLEWGQTEDKLDEMMIVDGGAVKGPSE